MLLLLLLVLFTSAVAPLPLCVCLCVLVLQGPVNLEKGTKHFLRRCDVEDLIRQGRLEHIELQQHEG